MWMNFGRVLALCFVINHGVVVNMVEWLLISRNLNARAMRYGLFFIKSRITKRFGDKLNSISSSTG